MDTENSGLHPDDGARVACVALTWRGSDGLETRAFPFDQGVRDKITVTQLELGADAEEDPNLDEPAWWELLEWLDDQQIAFHNAKYDLTMLEAGTRHWPGADLSEAFWWDTLIAGRELDPLEAAGLDEAAKRLGIGDGKEGQDAIMNWCVSHGHPKRRYDLAPWSVVEPYVRRDTELAALLYEHQMERLREHDAPMADRIVAQFDFTRTLFAVEQRGIGYDFEQSLEAAELLDRRAAAIATELPFNPDVKKEVAGYFEGTLGHRADRRTPKKGDPQIDEEQLREWIAAGVPNAAELDAYNRCKRAVSMWYRGYPEKMGTDGRLRTSFKQNHVVSGRVSVERVQLQAMPKKDKYANADGTTRDIFEGVPGVRDLIVPDEGKKIWTLDLSQAELRVATVYSACKLMRKQLDEGQDIHGNTCMEVLEKDPSDPHWKEHRDIAKRLTFGGIFQIGGEKFQATLSKLAGIHWELERCEVAVRRWRRMYPEFGTMYYKSMRMVERQGWVPLLPKTDFEVRSYFGPRDYPNSGWNRVVQGSLAEAFKQLLVGVERIAPGTLVLTVHDSVYLECPIDEGAEVARRVRSFGSELMSNLFDIHMDMDIDDPKGLMDQQYAETGA